MSLSACDRSSLDLRDSDGLSRAAEALPDDAGGGWMVVEDSVDPGRLASGLAAVVVVEEEEVAFLGLGTAAVVSSSESSSQPASSSSAEAAVWGNGHDVSSHSLIAEASIRPI